MTLISRELRERGRDFLALRGEGRELNLRLDPRSEGREGVVVTQNIYNLKVKKMISNF